MKYYQELALKLFENGYKPIPIKPKSKIPFMVKGESWQVDITREQVEEWVKNGKGGGGVGLVGLGALDFDIYDKKINKAMADFIKANINSDICFRVGEFPKFLVPLSPTSAIEKKRKITRFDKSGVKHEIEILSPGDQYFCAYGIHPVTGKEFSWARGNDVIKIKAADLPVFDEMDISMIEDEFTRLADEAGWVEKADEMPGKKKKDKKNMDPVDPLEHLKMSGDMADDAGLAELTAWVNYLPQDYKDDYDLWISTAAAIHHETGGSNDGWALFDTWSQGSEKYKGRVDTIARWESFDKNKGIADGVGCSTRGTIIHGLQECGKWQAARKAGEEARIGLEQLSEGIEGVKQSQDIIEELNKKHAIISIGGKVRVLTNDLDYCNELDLKFSSVQDFKTLYANRFVKNPKNPKKEVNAGALWLSSPDRREYKGILFEPSQKETPGYYNLWTGFAVKPRQGDWSRYKGHIEDIIADGNEKIARYIMAWLSKILQDPGGRRPGTSLVLRGGQGTGKGVFVNTYGDLFGQHFLPVSHASQIAGRFNGHLKNKLLVFIDEGFWAGDKAAEGVMKSIITEPWIAIEQKNQDTIRVKNHTNIIMASNNEWVVPANKGERRYHVLDIPDSKQGDHGYFDKLITQMYKQGGLEAMLFDLLKTDYSDVNLAQFEDTKGLFEQKVHTMSTEMQYWFECLQAGRLRLYNDDYNNHGGGYGEFNPETEYDWFEIRIDDHHADYLRFAEKMKDRYPKSPGSFGFFIRSICPWIKRHRKRCGTKLEWWKRFPSLNECRAEFERQTKTKIEWDKEDDLDEPDLF